jgi:hypothetical protein
MDRSCSRTDNPASIEGFAGFRPSVLWPGEDLLLSSRSAGSSFGALAQELYPGDGGATEIIKSQNLTQLRKTDKHIVTAFLRI